MKYTDNKGETYEISYSQRLQREQNRILKRKNSLLMVIIVIMILFGVGIVYLYLRLEAIDFLTSITSAISR